MTFISLKDRIDAMNFSEESGIEVNVINNKFIIVSLPTIKFNTLDELKDSQEFKRIQQLKEFL